MASPNAPFALRRPWQASRWALTPGWLLPLSLLALASLSCAPPGPEEEEEHSPSPAPTEAPTVMGLFDQSLSTSFFDFPWPSDARVDEAGHPIMDGFPNPDQLEILDLYMETLETEVVGFGNNAPVYFRFSGDLETARLPALPVDSLEVDATLQLVNLEAGTPDYGRLVPVSWSYFQVAGMYNPDQLLAMAPAWGFPLLPHTRYGAVVLTSVGAADGGALGPDPALRALLSDQTPLEPAVQSLSALYAPLRAWLTEVGLDPSEVAAATVFTTQDPVSEMATIRDFIRSSLPLPTLDPDLEIPIFYVPDNPEYEKVHPEEERLHPASTTDPYDQTVSQPRAYHQFEGQYWGPNFQEGEPPYAEEGGAIRFDDAGNPLVERWEPLRFCLVVPLGEPPAGGWPIAIFAHGTGGNYKDLMYSGTYKVAELLTARGIAVIGIDEPLHANRAPAGTDPDLMSFNFMNPDAARSNFRQAAIDVFYLTWLVQTALTVPAAQSPTGKAIRFDPQRVSFVGHSHGGLSGSLLTPFEPELQASVLSGAGGGLCLTILLRTDYVDFAELFRTMLHMPAEEPLDAFHPVMGVVQTLVDITDPINYSPLFGLRPLDHPRNVLQTEGFWDAATPPMTAEAMAAAGALPYLMPLGRVIPALELQGVMPVSRPLSGNVTGPDGSKATMALAQFPEDNHYAIFRDYDAARLYADFVQSVSYTASATLQ